MANRIRAFLRRLHSSWRAHHLFRREQTPAWAVVNLHVAVSVILSKKAPNHLVRYDVRMDGQRRAALAKHKGERQWTRPHYSSSFSWCCCSAAADSSTVAGFESDGRRTDTAPADLGGIGDRTRCESYDRAIVPRLVRWAHSCCHAKSRIV